MNKFNATSDLHIRRDGIKEVYFTDNNGNVRVVIDSNNNIKKYDYKPFGELYWSSDGSHLREGLEGSIFDPESELQMKGVRMYDTETGRFTTLDLLWSAFPSHTPYHYAYNSPMIWSDPSGLAPEKERDRERLLNIELDWEGVYNVWNEIQYENGRVAMMQYKSYIMDFKEAFKTRFGESSGNRTGDESGAKNGQGGKTTGIVAKSNQDKENIKKSVEKEFQKYIDFDDEGKVIILEGGNEAAKKNPGSNYGKLYEMATNDEEVFFVEGITKDKTLLFYHGNDLNRRNNREHTQSLNQISDTYFGGQLDCHVIFFANDPRSYLVYHSLCQGNLVYYVIGGEAGWLAHELFYHGYKYLKMQDWTHKEDFNVRQSIEFKNANIRKK